MLSEEEEDGSASVLCLRSVMSPALRLREACGVAFTVTALLSAEEDAEAEAISCRRLLRCNCDCSSALSGTAPAAAEAEAAVADTGLGRIGCAALPVGCKALSGSAVATVVSSRSSAGLIQYESYNGSQSYAESRWL
jgi:hypothetical protein